MICWLKQTRWTLIGIVLAGLVTDARALDPNRLPSQYVREQWTTETGFPGGAVNGIAQTADGYLWIGTDRGLLRFDGFNFRPVSFTSIATASNVPILQLLTDAGGKLWIRPQGADLVRQKDGKFESVRYGPDAITALSKDNNGEVLVSSIGQGTFRFTAGDVQKLGPSSPPVISMAETSDGKVWLGTLGDGLFFLTGGRATNVNAGLPDRKINSLLPIGEELWVGTDTGLYRGNGTGFRRLELPSFLGNVQVLSLLRDRDSNIWVGTTRGLLRINGKGISFSEEDELRGEGGITVLFEDREGNLWIGGARGLGRIRDSAFVTYSSVSDRRFEHNGPVYVDPEGRTWFAPAQGGLYVLQNGRVQPVTSIPPNEVVYSISGRADVVWAGRQRGGLTRLQFRNGAIASQSYTEANGLAQNSVYAVYESRDGSVWAGTLNGGVSKFKDGHFTTYTTANGLASNTVSSILETRDGAMWFATPAGLSSFSNGQWRTYTTVEGLPSPEVNCLFEDSSGTLWSGTSAGLASFASGHFQVPKKSPDVLREQILGMVEDKSGRFWIATSHHVLRIPRGKLLSGVVKAGDVREYDQADGLESTEGVKRSRSVVSDSAGRIWFSLSRGLSVVNASQITDNSVPALPHIEAITADNNTANLAGVVQIPPSPRRITFEYTGLSLAAPGRIRFRYFLEGFDRSWSQPVAAREAVYTNLGPGSYRFRLVASNSEGMWNGPETAIALTVARAYYQTYWFRLLCVAVFIALLWTLHRWRIHRLKSQEKHMRDVVDTIPAIVWSALPDGSNTYVNKRFVEYSGSSAEQTAGSGWQALIHPDDLERHAGKWMEAVATGKPHESEVRSRRSDGQYRWQLDRGVPLRDGDGNIVKWYGVTTDIEDRKRAEEAALRSEEELRALIENIPAMVFIASPGPSNEFASRGWREYTGLSAEDTAGSGWQSVLHPEDLKRHAEKWRVCTVTGEVFEDEARFRRAADGEYRWFLIRAVPLRAETGTILKWYGVLTDIEDRKRAEEALQLTSHDLQDSKAKLEDAQRITHVGYWEWDLLTDRVNWSDETYRIYGLRPQERPMDLATVRERIHPEDWQRFGMEEALGGARFDAECRLFRPTGEMRIVHFQGDVKRDASGRPYRMFGTVQDITDRKRAEQRLRESEAYLAEAQRLSQTGSWAWNPATGDIRYWSEMCYCVLGFDPAGPLPRFEEFFHRIHPDDQAAVRERFEKAIRDKADFELDYRIVHPEKEIRDIHVVGHAVLDGSSNLGEFVGTVIDVTERKCAEEALQQSQFYLAEGQRLAQMGSWAFNPSGFFDYWSPELFQVYGLDPQKGAPTLEQYLASVHPQDRDFMANTIKRMLAEHGGCDVKKRIVLPDGEQRYIRCVGIPVVEGEVLKGFLGTAMDITEQELLTRELEFRQVHLAEAQKLTHTGSWVWRLPDRNAVHLSAEWYRIYGFDPAEGAARLGKAARTRPPGGSP